MPQPADRYFIFDAAAGFCGIAWNKFGINRFQLPSRTAQATERNLLRRLPAAQPGTPANQVVEAIADAQRYFNGDPIDFSRFQLDLAEQDRFFKQIYAAARGLAWGQTTSYGALAKQLGAGPQAARDVGQAMARNPVPLIIPCHRVPAAGGKVGGFSAPGGQNPYASTGRHSSRATAADTTIARTVIPVVPNGGTVPANIRSRRPEPWTSP